MYRCQKWNCNIDRGKDVCFLYKWNENFKSKFVSNINLCFQRGGAGWDGNTAGSVTRGIIFYVASKVKRPVDNLLWENHNFMVHGGGMIIMLEISLEMPAIVTMLAHPFPVMKL